MGKSAHLPWQDLTGTLAQFNLLHPAVFPLVWQKSFAGLFKNSFDTSENGIENWRHTADI